MSDSVLYQQIVDLISSWFPAQWERAVFYAEYGEASYVIEFYVLHRDVWTKCFDLPGATVDALIPTFIEADKLISSERRSLAAKDLWSCMTLVVANDGHLRADYEYEDLSESSFEHKEAWRRRYLT